MDTITATVTITKARFLEVQSELNGRSFFDEAEGQAAWEEYREEVLAKLWDLGWASTVPLPEDVTKAITTTHADRGAAVLVEIPA